MSFFVLQQLTDPFHFYLNALNPWESILNRWQLDPIPQPLLSVDLLTASLSPIPLWNNPYVSTVAPHDIEEGSSLFFNPPPPEHLTAHQPQDADMVANVPGTIDDVNPEAASPACMEPQYYPAYDSGIEEASSLSPLAFHLAESAAGELSSNIISSEKGDTWICNWNRNLHVIIKHDHRSVWMLCPFGTIEKQPNKIHAFIQNLGRRYVKFWQRGISFSSQNNGLPYLMDPAGVRLQWDSFKHCLLNPNQIWKKLVSMSTSDSPQEQQQSRFYITELITDHRETTITFNDGITASVSERGKIRLHAGDMYATASIKTDGKSRHMFVRRQTGNTKERFHYDGRQLFVRSAGQEAYLDINGDLRL